MQPDCTLFPIHAKLQHLPFELDERHLMHLHAQSRTQHKPKRNVTKEAANQYLKVKDCKVSKVKVKIKAILHTKFLKRKADLQFQREALSDIEYTDDTRQREITK